MKTEMVDLRSKQETAALLKLMDEQYDDFRADSMRYMIWAVHELASDEELDLPDLDKSEVQEILAEMPTNKVNE